MATLFLTVWAGSESVAAGPVLNEQPVSIGGASVQSGVMDPGGGNRSRTVRVMADTNCFVTWGSNPTAVSDGTEGRPMGAENPEYFFIKADEKIAVIERT